MIGSMITRFLVMVFGYAYPAYQCYKAVEKSKPDVEQLRFWCQYWILVAVLTVCERGGDAFISWVPMYSEAKLTLFVYLWYPKTLGTSYVYASFLRPYLASHEHQIDRNLNELKIRAADIIVLNFHKASAYGQTRIFDVLKFIAAQSSSPAPVKIQQNAVSPDKHHVEPVNTQKVDTYEPASTRVSLSNNDTQKSGPSMSLREAMAMEIDKDDAVLSENNELKLEVGSSSKVSESKRVGLRSRLLGRFK